MILGIQTNPQHAKSNEMMDWFNRTTYVKGGVNLTNITDLFENRIDWDHRRSYYCLRNTTEALKLEKRVVGQKPFFLVT